MAGQALATGWRSARPADELIVHPHSDGSTGFLQVVPGSTEIFTVDDAGHERPVSAVRAGGEADPWSTTYCHTDSFQRTEQVLAEGLRTASSAPVGQMLGRLLERGATRIIIGAGHAPWHDGGAGLLHALAGSLHVGQAAIALRGGTGAINPEVATLLEPVREALAGTRILVASSREVPLRGLHGAGAELAELPTISAAQAQQIESLTAAFVAEVDNRAQRRSASSLIAGETTVISRRSYAGAGGGVAFILAALGAQVFPGPQVTAEATGLDAAVAGADLVVTGAEVIAGEELGGGVVSDVAARAGAGAIPVVVVGGRVDASRRQMFKVGIHAAYPVIDTPATRPQITAPPVTEAALVARGERLARTWSQ